MVRGSKVRMNGVSSDDAMPVRMDEHSKSKGNTMPADTQPIPIGTKVRIFDSRGFNIFDRSLRTEAKPKDKDTASYPVQGFYKSGQRYENTRLWL